MNVTSYPSAKASPDELLNALKGKPTATVSDVMGRLNGTSGLRPFHKAGYLAGTAVTVRTTPGDNLGLHHALAGIRPGDVLVVEGGGSLERALVGEILKEIAVKGGSAGFVIDGAIRDADAFANDSFPCFARGVSLRGPHKFGPAQINIPITVGGSVVHPGDIVLGDIDGVIFVPQADALEIAHKVVVHEAKELEIIESIRAGTYQGSYGTS